MKDNYLVLTGGLGNQLFQIAALTVVGDNHRNHLDIVNGLPRKNHIGIPDAWEFNLEGLFHTENRQMPLLLRRAVGYCLRSHLEPRAWEDNPFVLKLARLATGILASIHFRRYIKVSVARNLGFDDKFKIGKRNNLLIGYFQTARWAVGLVEKLSHQLKLSIIRPEVLKYKRIAEEENPLVVHIRLGDYLDEGGFGIPGHSYYERAIDELSRSGNFGKIWLFSDDSRKALERLPKNLQLELRIFEEENFSPAETIEVMRLGQGYVIANSTFSWWGAYLSYTERPRVIFPNPWFKSITSPAELTPDEWEGYDADF